jgi:hypothetical protein
MLVVPVEAKLSSINELQPIVMDLRYDCCFVVTSIRSILVDILVTC